MENREITEDRFIECMAIDFPNFKITKSNLAHPTSQFVISFYSLMLRNILELNDPEEIWNITEDQRAYINSYHAEAVSFGQHVWAHNLHSAIKYIFNHLGENGSEFVYSDILFPENTPRRSFVFMALMLNFYWYTNDFADELNNDINSCIKKSELKTSLVLQKEKLMTQLKELEFQKCHYAESYADKKKLVRTKVEANEALEVTMKDLQSKEELVKKELEKIEEEEQKLQASLTSVQNEKKYFESLIVSDERQVQDIYEKYSIKKDECVKRMKNLEEQVKMASHKLTQSNKILELQQKLNSILREEKCSDPHNNKIKGFQSLNDSITQLMEKKKKLEDEELEYDQKLAEAQEMLSKLKEENLQLKTHRDNITAKEEEKIVAITKSIDEFKTNHSEMIVKIKKDSGEKDEIIAANLDLSSKCNKIKNDINAMDSKNKTTYKNYRKEMKAIFNYLETVIGDPNKMDHSSSHSFIISKN